MQDINRNEFTLTKSVYYEGYGCNQYWLKKTPNREPQGCQKQRKVLGAVFKASSGPAVSSFFVMNRHLFGTMLIVLRWAHGVYMKRCTVQFP